MPEKKKQSPFEKPLLTNQQITEIKSEVANLKRMLKGEDKGNIGYHQHSTAHIANTGEVVREIKQKENLLKDHSPQKFNSREANVAYAWAKKAERWIRENMPSDRDHRCPYPRGVGTAKQDTNFEQAVNHQMQWMLHSKRIIAKYKHVMRRLDPDNPNLTNIERFRR